MFHKDATYYYEQLMAGETTSLALVEQAIDTIIAMNDAYNAVVYTQFDQAREEARRYDRLLAELKGKGLMPEAPFFGVPILLKDLGQNQAGQPSGSGAQLMEGYRSKAADHFVNQLLQAGFIVVGRTNVPEFGFKNVSDSVVYGRVNSPIDKQRNPGGSSGGAAAALKAGMAPIVTASDGGGSIRIPASFSGLIGLKPSRGRVPVGPGSYRGWQGASVNFALTKSVRDTWRLLKAMQVEQYEAPFMVPTIKETELLPLQRPLKIAYSLRPPEGSSLQEGAMAMMTEVIEKLESLGHTLVAAEPAVDGVAAMRGYYAVNGVETAVMMEEFQASLGRELSLEDMELMTWAIYKMGQGVSGTAYSKVLAEWDQLAAQSEAFFDEGGYDLFLTPATNGPAPLHEAFVKSKRLSDDLAQIERFSPSQQADLVWEMFADSLAWTPFTQQMNLTGQPAISLPLYQLADTGLPLGTQFSAPKGQEYLLLQLAKQLEDQGWLDTAVIN